MPTEAAPRASIPPRDDHGGDGPTDHLRRDAGAHAGARKEGAEARAIETAPSAGVPPEDAPVAAPATQTIPPALRRAVLVRDQHRCQVPGCKNAAYLDLHHLSCVPRAVATFQEKSLPSVAASIERSIVDRS